MRKICIISAPSNLGLTPPAPGRDPGTVRAPLALFKAGLLQRLRYKVYHGLKPADYQPRITRRTRVRNLERLRQFSRRLARHVTENAPDYFPLVIGGDSSLLIGALLGLKRVGRCGLIYLSGGADFLTSETSTSKAAAGMTLALATGYGYDKLTNLEGQRPYVRDSNAVVFGNRDMMDRESYLGNLIFETDVSILTLDYAREIGLEMASMLAVELLKQRGVDGFWLHFDASVLDCEVMPAVAAPLPGGMSYAEMITVLRVFLDSGLAVGMDITGFDPDRVPDDEFTRLYVDALIEALQPAEE
ncbi:MAG: arginase family protein [Anaerolineae bacterium]|nr:arginase family protein [Anaerolineae bacterium]